MSLDTQRATIASHPDIQLSLGDLPRSTMTHYFPRTLPDFLVDAYFQCE